MTVERIDQIMTPAWHVLKTNIFQSTLTTASWKERTYENKAWRLKKLALSEEVKTIISPLKKGWRYKVWDCSVCLYLSSWVLLACVDQGLWNIPILLIFTGFLSTSYIVIARTHTPFLECQAPNIKILNCIFDIYQKYFWTISRKDNIISSGLNLILPR